MPTELTPISPVQIQGDTLGLYFGSVNDLEPSNWLWIGGTKIYFDNTNNYIDAAGSTNLRLNAAEELLLSIAGATEARLTANVLTFNAGAGSVGLDWSTDLELDVLVGGTAQVTFTDGTFEPAIHNNTDLGTSSKEFKRAFFSGAVLASTYESDVTTGTAPLIVASTTKVSNLDVDAVDGLHVATSGGALADMSAENTWSAHQLFDVATELQLRNSNTKIWSGFAGFLAYDSTVLHQMKIAGTDRFVLSAASAAFANRCQAVDFKSTVATGTAPLIVASTTRVSNLNVTDSDQVDGKHAADLNPATTKGDLILQDASATVRLPVGTNGQVLTADSSEALGVKWATP